MLFPFQCTGRSAGALSGDCVRPREPRHIQTPSTYANLSGGYRSLSSSVLCGCWLPCCVLPRGPSALMVPCSSAEICAFWNRWHWGRHGSGAGTAVWGVVTGLLLSSGQVEGWRCNWSASHEFMPTFHKSGPILLPGLQQSFNINCRIVPIPHGLPG